MCDKLGESRLLKWALVIFGGAAAFFLYGAVVDMWTILMMTEKPSLETALVVYTAAVPFNIVHAAATMIFILLLAVPVTKRSQGQEKNMERFRYMKKKLKRWLSAAAAL